MGGFVPCPRCGRRLMYLRLNLSIHCDCGEVIDRATQLRIVERYVKRGQR